MARYAVHYSHTSQVEHYDTYGEALSAVRSVWRRASIGHDGDIDHGGERTLVWPDSRTARNDDGSRACASITRQHELD